MAPFDPYHRWLGIPPKHQPPDHYRLLGLERFESDPEVIRDAAEQRMAHVRTYQLGPNSDLSQKILNELGRAKACLLNPKEKAAYDAGLRSDVAHQPTVAADANSSVNAEAVATPCPACGRPLRIEGTPVGTDIECPACHIALSVGPGLTLSRCLVAPLPQAPRTTRVIPPHPRSPSLRIVLLAWLSRALQAAIHGAGRARQWVGSSTAARRRGSFRSSAVFRRLFLVFLIFAGCGIVGFVLLWLTVTWIGRTDGGGRSDAAGPAKSVSKSRSPDVREKATSPNEIRLAQSSPIGSGDAQSSVPAGAGRIDVLKQIDPRRDAMRGKWEFDGSDLIAETIGSDPFAFLQVPGNVPDEYQLTIIVERIGQHTGLFSCRISVAGHPVAVVFDSCGGQYAGLNDVDGKQIQFPGNPTGRKTGLLIKERPVVIVCTVNKKHEIRVVLDGKPFLEWTGDPSRLSKSSDDPLPVGRFGLAIVGTRGQRDRFRIRSMTLSAGPLPPTATGEAMLAPPSSPLDVARIDAPTARENQVASARRLGIPVETTNRIGMKMALVPAGEFLMGSPSSDTAADVIERPQRRVRITKAFYLGATEVTQGQYEKVMGRNPSWFSAGGGGKDTVAGVNTSDFPVDRVSWDDAVAFCQKLSALEGKKYRLPTEAEWEYACRAGSNTTWCFGDDQSSLKDHAWYQDNAESRTHAVAMKKPNAWGLYDMYGNVWEWCQDRHGGYQANSPMDDPAGPATGAGRASRGGSWLFPAARSCRSSFRGNSASGDQFNVQGFRVSQVVADK